MAEKITVDGMSLEENEFSDNMLNAELSANMLTEICHSLSKKSGWWPEGAREKKETFPVKLMLCVSELSEAMEGDRKSLNDDHLPHRSMREVELADALIRIFDLAGAYGLDVGGALAEKLAYNQKRADHKKEMRDAPGGKTY